jgi:hypothetical protein
MTDDIPLDVGLIRIDPRVVSQLRNKEIFDKQISLYSDSFQSIFGKEVKKYKANGNHYEICKFDTSDSGFIASETEHKQFGVENAQFLVKGTNNVFAKEGESGTAIAVKSGEGNVTELIGLLCGGSKGFTVCLFLPTVLEYLNTHLGYNLKLYEPEGFGADFAMNGPNSDVISASKDVENQNAKKYIPSGIKIYFSLLTTERVAPLEFNLVERVLTLLCKRFIPIDLNKYEVLLKREQTLSLLVSKRETISDNAIFENESPDFVAVKKGINACDCLYLGKAVTAETLLKQAISCIMKTEEDLALRLLCKLVSYITWHCLVKNTPDSFHDLKVLLEEGIDIFETDFKDLIGFPLESLGYLYYDFSRFYMKLWENEYKMNPTNKYRIKAVEKAKQAVNIFREDHINKQKLPETARRLVLAQSQLIYSLLGCGHSFNTYEDITNEELTEAGDIFKSINLDMDTMPFVQIVNYFIALCDLQFRKGNLSKAFHTARKCLKISENKGYRYGAVSERAKFRVMKLRNYKSEYEKDERNKTK